VYNETEKNEDEDKVIKDSIAWLAADLIENKKISVETLIKLQAEEEKINIIRENLQGNSQAYNNFILKNWLVCKKYTIQHAGITHVGIYIPTVIAKAVILYIHRRNMHTSITQTTKEFNAHYYHPRASKLTKEVMQRLHYMHTEQEYGKERNKDRKRKNTKTRKTSRRDISGYIIFPTIKERIHTRTSNSRLILIIHKFLPDEKQRKRRSSEMSQNLLCRTRDTKEYIYGRRPKLQR
jgi:hypothetical protein